MSGAKEALRAELAALREELAAVRKDLAAHHCCAHGVQQFLPPYSWCGGCLQMVMPGHVCVTWTAGTSVSTATILAVATG